METLIEITSEGDNEAVINALKDFVDKNANAQRFGTDSISIKKDVWTSLARRIQKPESTPELLRLSLHTMRILSREKSTLDNVVTDEIVDVLLEISKFKDSARFPNCGPAEILEGMKVVYNLIFQSPVIQVMLLEHEILVGLMSMIREFRSDSCKHPTDVKFFAFRILFLITALCQHVRPKVREDFKGIIHLSDFLEDQTKKPEPYDDATVDVLCECLKILYNIIHEITAVQQNPVKTAVDEQDYGHMVRITTILKLLLNHETVSIGKKYELHSHSVDLLNAVTVECYEVLIPESGASSSNFLNKDMSTIDIVVEFLNHRLIEAKDLKSIASYLPPVLCVLVRMVRNHRPIRKYLKSKILPPLTKADIIQRPEVGNSLRNRLCALLTSPVNSVTEMVANFLFILCKENVGRMIKYTGYGNAAGLLANRGLLLGGAGSSNKYSSDSDSDTEDYREVRHLINDVEGYLQEERPAPCEGMSDEQKEYEAMKLVEAIDKLNRQGLIQPCTIGDDGKPVPVEHVLQLQEYSEKMRRARQSDDEDA